MGNKMKYKWLLFDADGTLFDFEKAALYALISTFDETGLEYKTDYYDIFLSINHLIWSKFENGEIEDMALSEEERPEFFASVVRAAFLHDLGKIGNEDILYYKEQLSDWHRKRGMVFEIDYESDLTYLPVPIRSLWWAQKFGVYLSEEEVQAILCHDGPDSKGGNLVSALNEGPLTMILHFADKWVGIDRAI